MEETYEILLRPVVQGLTTSLVQHIRSILGPAATETSPPSNLSDSGRIQIAGDVTAIGDVTILYQNFGAPLGSAGPDTDIGRGMIYSALEGKGDSGGETSITPIAIPKRGGASVSTGPTSSLAFYTGTYLRFDNPQWWSKSPKVVDISNFFRVISIDRKSVKAPSIESKSRKIVIECDGKYLSINGQGTDVIFNRIHARGRLKIRQETKVREWVLKRIKPDHATRLKINSSYFVIEYDRQFAECVWFLLERHPKRGEAGYILLKKEL